MYKRVVDEDDDPGIIIQLPYNDIFTIYSKSGCKYCLEVKKLLENQNKDFLIIDCDNYLIENKTCFLQNIKELAKKDHKTFPIVFHNKVFIGGFNETNEYLDTLNAFENYS
jgi:hypothetical protein